MFTCIQYNADLLKLMYTKWEPTPQPQTAFYLKTARHQVSLTANKSPEHQI